MSNPNIASRFGEIYNSTNKAVLTLITAKCGRTADISDIFQETYLDLYKILDERGADYVIHKKAYVLRIAKRKIARYYSLLEYCLEPEKTLVINSRLTKVTRHIMGKTTGFCFGV